MDFFLRFSRIIKTPHKYFVAVKKEGLREPLVFYMIILAVVNLLGAASYLQSFELGAAWYPLLYLGIFVFSLMGVFIGAGVTHLFVMLFKGVGSYVDTFKANIYGSIPSMVFAIPSTALFVIWPESIGVIIITSIFGMFVWGYTIFLNVVGLSELHTLSTGKAVAVAVLPFVIFMGIIFIAFIFIFIGLIASGGI